MKEHTPARGAQLRDDLRRLALMVLASAVMAVNLKSFVQAGDLVPGGFNGLSLLIQRIALRYWDVAIPFTAVNFLLNAVPAVMSYKFIGKRFTLYSCVVVVLSSVLTDLIPDVPITDDLLLICVFGGIINGLATALCLKGRATSGGTDFISIALSERWNVDAWNYILAGNVVMLGVAGALFGWDKALYSIIFQFASTQAIRLLDSSFKRVTLLIVAGEGAVKEICAFIHATHHSATLMEGQGTFNGERQAVIYTVVDSSQVRQLRRQIRSVAPGAFINVMRSEQVAGNFYRAPRD